MTKDTCLDSSKYFTSCITNLQKWISINSVLDNTTSSKQMPFGQGVADALVFIGNLALQDGFKVDFCDGYCTEITYGNGPLIAIYGHADVVPVSSKWKHSPFGGEIEDEKMFGRGTSDDKGPVMAAYYALKMLKDNDLINGYKVALVVGGDEENDSRCLDYYFNHLHKPYPQYGFTPDGDFPLIYGEKSICNYAVTLQKEFPHIKSMFGGRASNIVIDEAKAELDETIDEIYVKNYCLNRGLRYQINGTTLILLGKASHGSLPELGINAGAHLMKLLGEYYHYEELTKTGTYYLSTSGKALGLYNNSPLLHETTFNLGLMDYQDGILTYTINFRYGEEVNLDTTLEALRKLNLGTVTIKAKKDYLLFNPQDEFIQTLLKVYQEETGDYKSKPLAIGGGTYAKESKNTVAFGSHFVNKVDHIHEDDEKIDLEDLTSSIKIYAKAVLALSKLGGK